MACVGTCHPAALSCRWRNCSWRGVWGRVLSPPSPLETLCGALGIKPGLTPCRGSKAPGVPLFCKLLSLPFSAPESPGLCLALSAHWSCVTGLESDPPTRGWGGGAAASPVVGTLQGAALTLQERRGRQAHECIDGRPVR